MFDRNGKRFTGNIVGNTPADLLASVLEQRYSKKTCLPNNTGNISPDPMNFPAVKKALGPVYEDIIQMSDELESSNTNEYFSSGEDMRAAVSDMTDNLFEMLDKIEESDKKKEKKERVKKQQVMAKKNDPYNREENNAYVEEPEIPVFDIPMMEMETSQPRVREHK